MMAIANPRILALYILAVQMIFQGSQRDISRNTLLCPDNDLCIGEVRAARTLLLASTIQDLYLHFFERGIDDEDLAFVGLSQLKAHNVKLIPPESFEV